MEKGNEHNFTSKQEFKSFFRSIGWFLLLKFEKKCRGRDLNPRTSAGTDLESVAVDQAWLPLHAQHNNGSIIINI
jgi:hypothetical protein